jgi:hypothetical protein
MAPFRRVEDRRAGPEALGILVPPGLRTVVILRPRSLPWDLLPLMADEALSWPPIFCLFSRDEAAGLARRVQRTLEQRVGGDSLEAVARPEGGYLVCWRGREHCWLVCPRVPGKPYEPAIFANRAEAEAAAALLARFLWPAPDAQQELYFNTQHFGERPGEPPG